MAANIRDIKRVLLIQPPCTISKTYTKEIQPPLGLSYIAALLEKSFEVKILDATVEGWERNIPEGKDFIRYGLSFEEVKEQISEYKPDVVGVSCLYSMQLRNAHQVCKIAKEVNGNIITVMGGAHPSALPDKVIEDSNIDYVVIGEGEYTICDLLSYIQKGEDISGLDGIAFRFNGKNIVNPKTRYIKNLDEIPFPARHLLPMDKYFKINMPHGVTTRRSPSTPIITSRGCPADCIFCSIHSIWGRKFRARSPENVTAEIKSLIDNYGIREIQFEDDNLTFDKPRALRICEMMIEQNLNLLWTTPNGIAMWALDEELLARMRQSGCYRLCLAIESGNEYVLKEIIKKPLRLDKAKSLINTARKYKFETDAFFVVGFPGETKEQIIQTFKFARNLNVSNVNYYIATPYPGTRLLEVCQKGNYLSKDFRFDNLGVKRGVISTPEFTPEELEKLLAKEMLIFRIRLAFKNPLAFYRKVIKRFAKDPVYFINLVKESFKKILSRRK